MEESRDDRGSPADQIMLATLPFPRVVLPIFAALALLAPRTVQAGEQYFMLIFGAQSRPKVPRLTHTFATIVKVAEGAADCPPSIEAYTISWLPRTLKVKPYRLHDEPGYNLTLEETLRWAYGHHMHVSLWGPYAISPDFFYRVYREYARIESGEFRYKAIDPRQRGSLTTDCIHAVTDIDRLDGRLKYPYYRSGDPATRIFVRVLRDRGRLQIPAGETCWLEAALGLNRYPVHHRPNP